MIQRLRDFLYGKAWLFSFLCRLRSILIAYGVTSFFAGIPTLVLRLFAIVFCIIPLVMFIMIRMLLDRNKARQQNQADFAETYENELSLVALVKDEGCYLKEWIEYYRMQGVDKFYLYDNGSTDCTEAVLAPYIESGLVEWIPFPGKYMQLQAFSDAIVRAKYKTRYLGFIDPDEFIVAVDERENLKSYVDRMLKKYPRAGGCCIAWLMFGSSHHKTRPEGLVIENYRYRAIDSFMNNVKTIGNPRLMRCAVSPHYPVYLYGSYNVNENGRKLYTPFDFHKSTSIIRINHYYTKSEEECMAKIAKGIVVPKGRERTRETFLQRDRNEVYDDTILRYLPELKKRLDSPSD